MSMNIRSLAKGLKYCGEATGKRQTYFVFESAAGFVVMSASRTKRASGYFNLVSRDAVGQIRKRYAGKQDVTAKALATRSRGAGVRDALQALNILEGMNVRYMRHNSAPYLHAVTESLKLAFADRNKYVADPKFTPNIPMLQMLSKEYATIRRALIDPDKAIAGEAPFGNPRQTATSSQPIAYANPQPGADYTQVITGEENGHTTYLAVVDKDRNMVSVTSSLLSLFGSGHVVKGAGFVLNNRMAYYGLDEDDINVLKPGKRVRQTINPALALKDGKPYMVFGTPGADTQPQAQLQFFLNVAEFGMNVQQALEQDYVVSTSFKSSYYPHAAEGKLQIPSTVPKHVLDELAAMGHKLDLRNVRGVGSVKAIIIHPRTGVLMGGVSPTRDSYVMAY